MLLLSLLLLLLMQTLKLLISQTLSLFFKKYSTKKALEKLIFLNYLQRKLKNGKIISNFALTLTIRPN